MIVSRDRYLAKLRRLGHLSPEERLKHMFDEGSLILLSHSDWDSAWQSAVIPARGLIDGKPVFAYASNFSVEEGSLGGADTALIAELLERAGEERAPVVALLQSNGARVGDRFDSLSGNARVFLEMTRLSGVVPQLAGCMGLCLGVAAYMATLSDFAWMIPGQSYAATTSPAVIKVATGQTVALDELGGAALHARNGVAHFQAQDELACLAEMRRVLGYLRGDRRPSQDPEPGDPEAIVPSSPAAPFDMRSLIRVVFDADSWFESHEEWGTSMLTGFARLEGRPIGVIANQPAVKGGVIDVAAARKAARFAQTCDSFGLPLIYLVDVPGLMVSPEQEKAGLLDAGTLLIHGVETDVPRIALVVRKCFGGAFAMMQARQAGGDQVLAYPTAQIGIAGAEATFSILHGKEYLTHDDAATFRKDHVEALRRIPSDAYAAQEAGLVDRVIAPRQTRQELVEALERVGDRPPRRRYPRRHPNHPW